MKQLSTFLLSIACTTVFAQAEVTSSAEFTNEPANQQQNPYWNRVLGQDETGYYLLRRSGPISNEVTIIEKFAPGSMKLVSTYEIAGASGSFNDSKLHRLTELQHGKIVTFWEGWSKAEGKNSFIVKELNEDGTLPDDEFVLETEPAAGQMRSANYKISYSPDGKKLLVLTQKPFAKDSKEMIRLQVFDAVTYQSLWKQNITLENESERAPDNNILVDNAGRAYIFKDVKITNKEHIYQLITAGEGGMKLSLIDLKTWYPTYHKMLFDGKGNLVIGGMLAEAGSNRSNWQAAWYFAASPEGEILVNNAEPLGAGLLRLMMNEQQAAKEGAKLSDYVLKDVLLKEEGGVLLIAEQQKDLKTIVGQTTPPVYTHDLEFGGVVLLSYGADGTRKWNTYYDKKQTEKSHDEKMHYGSFAYQLRNDNLYMVWNFTEYRTDFPITNFRYWVDRNGSKINIDNLYGKEAHYPTLLTVINSDGSFQYTERTFASLPLEAIQQPNAFPMAIDPSFYFTTPKGIIVLSRMPGPQAKRYKFNTINF
jgi:hypothetical protein